MLDRSPTAASRPASPTTAARQLVRPESAIYHAGAIYVSEMGNAVAFRGDLTADGSIVVVDTAGRVQRTLASGLKPVAKVVAVAVFSDSTTGTIWTLAEGKLALPTTLAGAPADIGYAAPLGRLLVPLLEAGRFTTLEP